MHYSRVLAQKPGGRDELFMGIGDGTPGATSLFLRSNGRGATWRPQTSRRDGHT
jgi:hypothetical protein